MKKKLIGMILAAGAMLGAWARTYTAADFGKVVCADGSVYATAADASSAGKTARAMIACVDGNYVLAIALADTSATGLLWNEAVESAVTWTADKAVAGGQWRLPSADDFKRIFTACQGYDYTDDLWDGMEYSWGNLQTLLSSAGGAQLDGLNSYWLSDEVSESNAYAYRTNLKQFFSLSKSGNWVLARAVLAFGAARTYKKVQLWENGPYWAETNIGADEPWDSGYYFWWGDTVGYKRVGSAWVASDDSVSSFSFSIENAQTYNKSPDDLLGEGVVTADYNLAPAYDAAQVQWGGGWRMPTYDDLQALCDSGNCDWTWVATNGVNGYIVSGKGDYASNSIFLPIVGYGDGTALKNYGFDSCYWISGVYADNYSSRMFELWKDDFVPAAWNTRNRHLGFPIRPVQDAPAPANQWTSGDCTVTLGSEGTLTVSGTGAMADYTSEGDIPWFANRDDIRKIVVESGVTRIGDLAFCGSTNLVDVVISNGVTSIGNYVFYYCGGLTGVTIPDSVTDIGEGAFYYCSALTDVTIPNGVTSIADRTFQGCVSLTQMTIHKDVTNIGSYAFYKCAAMTDVYCHPNAANLTWGYARGDFKSDGSTKIHVKASQLAAYRAKFGEIVRATFVGDLPGDATVTPDVSITAGEYFKATLAELGYDVPTDGQTAYSVKAYGLPAGLKLVGNKAVTKKDKKGKKVVVTPANVEWWIEGVPTAALDYATNPPYLVITVDGKTETLPLSLGVEAQEVTELEDLALGQTLNEQFYLPGVTNDWTVSGLPTGLKYTAKLVTTTKKKGKKIISVTTNALPYSVYGKTTKVGLFTITAKKKVGAYYETLKFRVLVNPAPVDTAIFGDELTNIVTMAYVPFEWDLTNDVAAVGGKVAKVAGLPAGLAFASATTYKGKKKTQVKQYGQTIVGKPTKPGTYVVTFTKNVTTGTGKKKKTVAKTAQILWTVTANDAELSLGFNTAGGEIVSGSVGLKYGDLMAFTATDGATVKASGLPKGITLANLGDGQYAFKGFTAKAGTYLVTVTATLSGKTVTQRVALKVDGLPDWAKGSFNGTVIYSKDIFAGLATMSVTAAGKISGKFQEFGTNWTFSASSYTNCNETESMYSATVTAKYAYKVKEKVKGKWKNVTKYLTREFTFDIAEDRGGGFGGVVLMRDCNDEADIRINAYQNLWGRSDYKALGKRIFWTSKKKPYKEFSDFVDVEGTSCPISLKITSSGVVTATLTFDTGKTKKNKKTKKVEPVYYKPSCTTVVIQQTAADADPFRGEIILYFAPSPANNFPGCADQVTVQP